MVGGRGVLQGGSWAEKTCLKKKKLESLNMGISNLFCRWGEKPEWLFVSCRCVRTRLTPVQIFDSAIVFQTWHKDFRV